MAYFIGNVTSLITEGDRIQSVKMQKLEEAQAFIDQKKLPRDLSRAILTHIRYHCRYNYVFDEGDLISSLPPNLQNQIHSRFAHSILSQLDFFESFTKSTNSMQTLGQISLKMRSISCNEGFALFSKGDRAKEIYIQRTGESVIDFHDGSSQMLYRGDVIGENCIVSPKRKYTVTCSTFSEFYILPISEIIGVLQTEYPTTWTRRWKNVVNDLKASDRRHGPKWIRTLNFNESKEGHGTEPDDGDILRLNTTEMVTMSNGQHNQAEHSSVSLSDDLPLKSIPREQRNSHSQRFPDRALSSGSNTTPKSKRKKLNRTSTFASLWVRRNSLDRDGAIVRSGWYSACCSSKKSDTISIPFFVANFRLHFPITFCIHIF